MTLAEFYKNFQSDIHEIIFNYLMKPTGWETAVNNAISILEQRCHEYLNPSP